MSIEQIKQDITTVEHGMIAHGVNCQGKMGAGVAAAIKKKWPIVYNKYKANPIGKHMLGTLQAITINENLIIYNCYTQVFYGYGGGKYASLDAVRTCLTFVIQSANFYGRPVYMPKIGCGLGGLKWDEEVKPAIDAIAKQCPNTNIYVCEL